MGHFRDRRSSTPDPLIEIARSHDPSAFARGFCQTQLTFLSLPPPFDRGLDPSAMTQEELLSKLESAVKNLSEATGFAPFQYALDGTQTLPLFSRDECVQQFVQWYVNKVNRVIPFQVLSTEGVSLVPALSSAGRVILNDRTPSAYELTSEDLAHLQELIV